MFSLGCELRYWLYSEPTDMRKSFHTLSGLVRNWIDANPMDGDVYIFVNKRRNRIKLLRGYRDTIQTDGYGAYDQFESDPHIQVIGCWAHARRKWPNALDEDKHTASEALAYINKLYHIENEAKEACLVGDALKEKRQKESYPIILQFEKWMYETVTRTSQNSRVGKAIIYSLVDSCKALGVGPREWMEDILLRIPVHESNRDALRNLMPDKWTKQAN